MTLKTALLAPMPRASEQIAVTASPLRRDRVRAASRTSRASASAQASRSASSVRSRSRAVLPNRRRASASASAGDIPAARLSRVRCSMWNSCSSASRSYCESRRQKELPSRFSHPMIATPP